MSQSSVVQTPISRAVGSHIHTGVRAIVGLWLVERIVLSLWAALCSIFPPVAGDRGTWPPYAPLSAWLDRVLLQPWLRWDAHYYADIAARGYRLDDGTAQFHPLFPTLGGIVGALVGSPLLGLMIVGSTAALGALLAFDRLARLDLAPADASRATRYFALSPLAFILFAPYSEALFLLCSILTLLYARRRRWWLAGIFGALTTLTRQQGLFLLAPLAWELWEDSGRDLRVLLRRWRNSAALLLVPGGYAIWLLYRGLALGDVSFDPQRPYTLIYSLLISSSSAKVVPVQAFLPPWQVLWTAVASLSQPQSFTTAVDLAFGGLALTVFVLGFRSLWRLRPSYAIYSAVLMLVSFSYYTGRHFPYMGLPRHCLLAFPMMLPLAVWGRRSAVDRVVLSVCVSGMIALQFLYSVNMNVWVP